MKVALVESLRDNRFFYTVAAYGTYLLVGPWVFIDIMPTHLVAESEFIMPGRLLPGKLALGIDRPLTANFDTFIITTVILLHVQLPTYVWLVGYRARKTLQHRISGFHIAQQRPFWWSGWIGCYALIAGAYCCFVLHGAYGLRTLALSPALAGLLPNVLIAHGIIGPATRGRKR
ncbi:hypothetical protein CYMTET_14339 [Cymbomonas tetramitiformis]|uniref:Uncharacterized protein n=1 Tax=Cymbomonas tetramitiformis TaxID=36881 RepID=A0AAE0GGK6_9CHLO|nr:hypothetical protein CYMTET_14339 [Cymbomonas tetramitiformis]